ncbi:MAG: cation:proton antiporter [Phycisphaerae bacterium]|nr:cation:proton antiporter [Phycisphaerae bacterium]
MHDLPLLKTIAAAFAAAWVLGLITTRLGLSPIVGYLLAGIAIGPHTPGFVGDPDVAHELSELGVILLMFGVGLHFHLKDLVAVKGIAIPGAIVQSVAATAIATLVFPLLGWSWSAGAVVGMAMAVASTVVLLRALIDRGLLDSPDGHAAVGWLIVEDVFTVLLLVLLPLFGPGQAGQGSGIAALGWALVKLVALVAIVYLAGSRVVPWVLVRVAKLRSRELFTLTVLVLSITVAVVSSVVFGASVALGAFLAGMVVGQSPVSHQAASDALPMRDAFAVIFFVSVGMLFQPAFVKEEPLLLAVGLGIVLVAKPLAALAIVAILGYPARTALTVAIGLAQIGEFSFILAQVASKEGLLPESGKQLLVAVAIVSIAINPILFRLLDPLERFVSGSTRLSRIFDGRAAARAKEDNAEAAARAITTEKPLAIIVGYGPVGRLVDAVLRDTGFETSIIDFNVVTVRGLAERGRLAIYGDATRPEILRDAGIERAEQLVVALPHSTDRTALVTLARELNPNVEISVRARYLDERKALEEAGATTTVFEEGEAGLALARAVMERRGLSRDAIDKLLVAVRRVWAMG